MPSAIIQWNTGLSVPAKDEILEPLLNAYNWELYRFQSRDFGIGGVTFFAVGYQYDPAHDIEHVLEQLAGVGGNLLVNTHNEKHPDALIPLSMFRPTESARMLDSYLVHIRERRGHSTSGLSAAGKGPIPAQVYEIIGTYQTHYEAREIFDRIVASRVEQLGL